jgi:erythrocyte band 7 integral membrane protein
MMDERDEPPLIQQPVALPALSTTIKQASFAEEAPVLSITTQGWYGDMMRSLGNCLGGIGSVPGCCCFPNPYHSIPQGRVGLLETFGQWERTVDPGLVHVNPLTQKIAMVDVRVQVDQVPSQVLMTKDNVTISLDSVLYWHVVSPYTAQYGVSNVRNALVERTQTTLRHVIGNRVLQDCVEKREELAEEIKEIVEKPAQAWGVKVESMLIKDMQFSKELQESLSAAAKSRRLGESKVIAARAEVEAAQLMRHAADILSSPAAMQLRYLESLQAMAKSGQSKVIFMPTGMTQEFMNPVGNKYTGSALQATMIEHLADTKAPETQGVSLSNFPDQDYEQMQQIGQPIMQDLSADPIRNESLQ